MWSPSPQRAHPRCRGGRDPCRIFLLRLASVRGQRIARRADRLRPAASGGLAPALAADERRDQARPRKRQLEGRRPLVGFQACDDSSAKTGLWTKSRCQANARAYAANPAVLGVVGTYNSGCAEAMIPILGRAPGGGVAMVSPGNTLICLTESSPSCPKGRAQEPLSRGAQLRPSCSQRRLPGGGPGAVREAPGGRESPTSSTRRGSDQPRPGGDLPRRRPQARASPTSASVPGTRTRRAIGA